MAPPPNYQGIASSSMENLTPDNNRFSVDPSVMPPPEATHFLCIPMGYINDAPEFINNVIAHVGGSMRVSITPSHNQHDVKAVVGYMFLPTMEAEQEVVDFLARMNLGAIANIIPGIKYDRSIAAVDCETNWRGRVGNVCSRKLGFNDLEGTLLGAFADHVKFQFLNAGFMIPDPRDSVYRSKAPEWEHPGGLRGWLWEQIQSGSNEVVGDYGTLKSTKEELEDPSNYEPEKEKGMSKLQNKRSRPRWIYSKEVMKRCGLLEYAGAGGNLGLAICRLNKGRSLKRVNSVKEETKVWAQWSSLNEPVVEKYGTFGHVEIRWVEKLSDCRPEEKEKGISTGGREPVRIMCFVRSEGLWRGIVKWCLKLLCLLLWLIARCSLWKLQCGLAYAVLAEIDDVAD